MGLRNYNFGNTMSLAIRVKFNSFPNHSIAYFGNWENECSTAGESGLTENKHNFYFNQYSNKYITVTFNIETKTNK